MCWFRPEPTGRWLGDAVISASGNVSGQASSGGLDLKATLGVISGVNVGLVASDSIVGFERRFIEHHSRRTFHFVPMVA